MATQRKKIDPARAEEIEQKDDTVQAEEVEQQDDDPGPDVPADQQETEEAGEQEVPAKSVHTAQLRASLEVSDEDMELVMVNVPKAFKLRVTQDLVLDVASGAQKMERYMAEHWYAKASGVRIVE